VNLVDVAVLVVIALSAIFAFARGFVREALSLAAWIGAALITLYGFNAVYRITARFVTTPLLADLVAGAALFLVSLILLTILAGYIASYMRWSALTPVDRTLGLIFGIARGAVLVSITYFLIDIALPPNDRPGWLMDARSQPMLAQGADVVRDVLPASLQLKSAAAVDDTQRMLGQARTAREAMGALSTPTVPIPPKPQRTAAPTYKPSDQHDLDRLIDNSH
jgi:membrane protein required for colicin V production